jgi:acetyl-CoA decarbonylase/synthase complex subunit delta
MELPKQSWTGKIGEFTINKVKVGGQTTLPFLDFEGRTSKPIIGMEVFDVPPEKGVEELGGIVKSPVEWAISCEREYKAEIISLNLGSTQQEGSSESVERAVDLVKEILRKVGVPLVIFSSGREDKDNVILKECAKLAYDTQKKCIIGNATSDNYKAIAALSVTYNQGVIAQTPMDVNLAKQLNILLIDMGVKKENILIDPLSTALGYGIEYTYSTAERIRINALAGDEMMQFPMIFFASKAWEAREVTEAKDSKVGIRWETITATSYLMSGADILITRNPLAYRKVRELVDELSEKNGTNSS